MSAWAWLTALAVGLLTYAVGAVALGRWVGRAAREQTTPATCACGFNHPGVPIVGPDAEARPHLDAVEASFLAWVVETRPRIPQQGRFHPVGPPLDVDALIASLEPCGTGVVPTCRLHDEETCRLVAPCCPSCPSVS